MYCLETIKKINEKTNKDEKQSQYFGAVKWSIDDLKAALDENGRAITSENISKLYNAVNNHFFTDYIISAGWDYIYSMINNLTLEEKSNE